MRTRAAPLGIEVVVGPAAEAAAADAFAALLQFPGADGEVRDYRALADAVHAAGALVVVAADLLALTLLAPPGEWGADVVVGSSQRFGVPMGFGGPHAGYLATRDEFKRSMPGRLVGVTVDADGNPAYRLALQTREQHIRREKATSNICTAQVLLAVIAAMYAVYHGPVGLTRIARRVHRLRRRSRPASNARDLRCRRRHSSTPSPWPPVLRHAAILARGVRPASISAGSSDAVIGLSLDETTTREDVERVVRAFAGERATPMESDFDAPAPSRLPAALLRTSAFLTHPTFNRYHSETEMLRYLRRLADRDIALDRAMIPLGSCTMKLNATAEMIPVTWPEFGALHPFAPADQAQATRTDRRPRAHALRDHRLCRRVAAAQCRLAGRVRRPAHDPRVITRAAARRHRHVCLIPASAHGTNPASAQMAGMQVVVVACDDDGNVDLADLEAKAKAHADDLAAIMVTYPSTHGVFEEGIRRICEIVHAHGGQVYVDGANLNALVGLAQPGAFGADVSHLNLHKTFCIPHGGGGPGVGPIAVGAHLAPFLPGHRYSASGDPTRAIAAAPYGSASILPISWMYIAMMGATGLTAATESAILAANYVAQRLKAHYPVLYAGPRGLVAHECILDLRPLKEASDVAVDDVAKRLIDYGFHAPTMSFPVPGTLMVEPTESESKAELDRFIAAMIAIRGEIRAVEEGRADRADNPLKHAPHTAAAVTADAWPHAYRREVAAYPLAALRASKYWPPVARVDNVYGDRNLFCSCVP